MTNREKLQQMDNRKLAEYINDVQGTSHPKCQICAYFQTEYTQTKVIRRCTSPTDYCESVEGIEKWLNMEKER